MLKTKDQKAENNETLEMCRKCYAFKYDNSWHFERPEYLLLKDADEKVSVRFSICSACVEEALALYDMEYA
jgi:hypothetical protein